MIFYQTQMAGISQRLQMFWRLSCSLCGFYCYFLFLVKWPCKSTFQHSHWVKICLCGSTCVCNNNMQHLVIWEALVFPIVALFLQLFRTSCNSETDVCFSTFVCFFFLTVCLFSLLIFHPSILSPSQTFLITWRWRTSPSRSSCWPLGWPQLEQEVFLRLQLHSGGASQFRSCLRHWFCFSFGITDPWTSTTYKIPCALCGRWQTFLAFWCWCKVQWPHQRKPNTSCICFWL